ncbi:beta-galactosidase BglB [Paenibacillus sp. y28]|uniref:beta-galactosidase BglB n=1 Tax=Paenibacillus sp. y28 TaxID=3129110 RepID=UPI003019FE9D
MNAQESGLLLERVFERMVSANKDNDNDHMDFDEWEWPVGVALFALFKYYRFTDKQRYLDFMVSWFDRQLDKGLPPKNVNSVAPLLTLAHIYELTGNERYLATCREWADWIIDGMPRTQEGGLQHITIIADNEEQLWDDTLFMTVLFLAKMGEILDRNDYREEAEYQFLLHIKYLADPASGLWYHGWTFDGRHNFGKTLWARGNCWYTAGVVEYLEISGVSGAVQRHLRQTLETQVKQLVKLQEPDGMWHTLLADPASYVETSATAGFGFGILKGVRKGYLDASYFEAGKKAAEAVISHIGEDGTVAQVSYGTAIGMNDQHYKDIPICPTAYGQALTMMILTEAIEIG